MTLEETGTLTHAQSPGVEMEEGMRELCEELDVPLPTSFRLAVIGNHVAALLHWSFLLSLAALLKPEELTSFCQLFQPSEEELGRLPKPVEGFDSHCHLDRTMRRFGVTEKSLQDILRAAEVEQDFRVSVKRVVGVFATLLIIRLQVSCSIGWRKVWCLRLVGILERLIEMRLTGRSSNRWLHYLKLQLSGRLDWTVWSPSQHGCIRC